LCGTCSAKEKSSGHILWRSEALAPLSITSLAPLFCTLRMLQISAREQSVTSVRGQGSHDTDSSCRFTKVPYRRSKCIGTEEGFIHSKHTNKTAVQQFFGAYSYIMQSTTSFIQISNPTGEYFKFEGLVIFIKDTLILYIV